MDLQEKSFTANTRLKILYLIPADDTTKGGMIQITKMFYDIGLFENKNIKHFNTFFKSGEYFFSRLFESFFSKVRFFFILIKFKPDVVFVMTSAYWGFFDKVVYCLIARMFGVKSMLNPVGDFADFYEESQWKAFCIRMALKLPSIILIGSVYWNQYFKTNYPFISIDSVVNPVDSKKYYRSKNRFETKTRIVSISGIVLEKGIVELVKVIQQVCSRSQEFIFIIMGVGDKLNWVMEELNTEIEKGLVEVKGLVSDAEKIAEFEIADIFMMLSHNEVIPISILEAMSASLPIISTNVGGIPDIVIHEKNGLLYPRYVVEPVVELILSLSGKKEVLHQMGKISRQIVTDEYDISQVLERHIFLAEKLVGN
mgnify:CR=1 FL=1